MLNCNEVIQGDCVEVLKGLPDSSVDFVLTDPPYLGSYKDRDGRTLANDPNPQAVVARISRALPSAQARQLLRHLLRLSEARRLRPRLGAGRIRCSGTHRVAKALRLQLAVRAASLTSRHTFSRKAGRKNRRAR